jgi:hypothetical protein
VIPCILSGNSLVIPEMFDNRFPGNKECFICPSRLLTELHGKKTSTTSTLPGSRKLHQPGAHFFFIGMKMLGKVELFINN